MSASQVEQKLFEAGGALLSEAQLFDVYEGENLGRGKKSLAYHLTYQSPSKTLRDKDADRLRNRLLSVLEKSLGATLRE